MKRRRHSTPSASRYTSRVSSHRHLARRRLEASSAPPTHPTTNTHGADQQSPGSSVVEPLVTSQIAFIGGGVVALGELNQMGKIAVLHEDLAADCGASLISPSSSNDNEMADLDLPLERFSQFSINSSSSKATTQGLDHAATADPKPCCGAMYSGEMDSGGPRCASRESTRTSSTISKEGGSLGSAERGGKAPASSCTRLPPRPASRLVAQVATADRSSAPHGARPPSRRAGSRPKQATRGWGDRAGLTGRPNATVDEICNEVVADAVSRQDALMTVAPPQLDVELQKEAAPDLADFDNRLEVELPPPDDLERSPDGR